MNAVALLLICAIAHLGPEVFSRVFGGRIGPWESVCYGMEAALLYLYAMARTGKLTAAEVAAGLYGFFESIQRPVCRAMLPMDGPPGLKPGQYLCDVATGFPVSALSPIALLVTVLVIAKEITKPSKVCSGNK